MFSKSKIFLIFCIAFILGIFFGRFVDYKIMAVVAMIFISIGSIWNRNRTVFILCIAGVMMVLGAWRFLADYSQNDAAKFYNQKAIVTGVIDAEPDVRVDKTYLTLAHVTINDQPIRSKILLSTSLSAEFEYGQKLRMNGKIVEPKEFPDFSYKNYLSRYGIDAVVYLPKVEVLDGNFGNSWMLGILRIKRKFVDTIGSLLPEPQNSFLAGLLLGAKRSIPQDLTDEFVRTGTSHIVAISGYNITIIAAAIEWLLAWIGLRKRFSFGISILAIVTFVVMTGASASAVRAGIMGILLLLALNVGRVSVAANALAFTAVVMLVISPQILAFDVGFQLSFAALLGIIYITPLLESRFLWFPKFLRQYFFATTAAQIFTLPILLFNFGTVSLVAILPNILVLPMVPISMLLGFMSGMVGLVSLKLALPIAILTKLSLSYILGIIALFSKLSFAAISWKINFIILAVYYCLLTALLIYFYHRQSLQNLEFELNLEHIKGENQ